MVSCSGSWSFPDWVTKLELGNQRKRGYVDQPEHWCYSSARNYAGQEGLIEVIRAW